MNNALKDVMTTKEVAERAKVTYGRICQLCQDGTLDAIKVGRDWLIDRQSALAWIYSDRKTGRPRKEQGDDPS